MFDFGLLFIPERQLGRIWRQVKLLEGVLQDRWRYSYPHRNALLLGKDKGLEDVTMCAREKSLESQYPYRRGDNSVLSVYRHYTLHTPA